jgi:hypothetical protein
LGDIWDKMAAMFTLLLVTIAAGSFLYEDPAADQAIRQTLQATYNLNLAEARRSAKSLQTRFPDHPVGFLMEAETYWWEAQSDPGNKAIERSYQIAQELAVDRGEKALQARRYPETEINAYIASAHGSKARFQLTQHGAGFGTVRTGMRAHSYAEKVYRADPNYIDILVGIGAYNYFADRVPTIIKPFAWLLGASGDAELGFQQMRTAIDKGRYSRTEGRIVYFTALMKDKQYAEALRVVERMQADYPNNYVLFTWVTQLFREQGKNLEGAAYFENKAQAVPRLTLYALLEKAELENAHGRVADARSTLARLRSTGTPDAALTRRIQNLEKSLRR